MHKLELASNSSLAWFEVVDDDSWLGVGLSPAGEKSLDAEGSVTTRPRQDENKDILLNVSFA